MIQVLGSTWALMAGMLLLMVGNGLQGTLLGVRGGIEGFSTFEMSLVMSAYFLGFLGGSRMTPEMIRRVGHVRVFAALASFISAVLILYPTIANPWVWVGLRVVIGFCFSGVYVTAESWLNHSVDNSKRGQALSLYMITQMAGIVTAQGVIVLGDPSGFILFVVPSVLVSISFAPILLSATPPPAFEATKPMSLRDLIRTSPLGSVGMFLTGGIYSGMFGMAAVYGSEVGLSVAQISTFVATIYLGGLICQFPIGWLSDRVDRRSLILLTAAASGGASVVGGLFGWNYELLLVAAFFLGGASNPLYALLIAYTNDFLDHADMAAASGRMMFLNGIGAILGPISMGWIMGVVGPSGFFAFMAIMGFALAGYAAYRMTQRAAPSVGDTGTYAPVLPSATAVVVEAAQEYFIEESEQADDGLSPAN